MSASPQPRRPAAAEHDAVERLEEAVRLLRSAPFPGLAVYACGTVPFVCAFLYFWSDMSRSAFALAHVAPAALGLAGLYGLKAICQNVFCRQLWVRLQAAEPPRWTAARLLRLTCRQTFAQATALVVLPLAAVAGFPLVWMLGFYHSLLVLDDGEGESSASLLREAWAQACLWPVPQHVAWFVLTVFGLVVFANVGAVLVLLPHLVKALVGVDSAFTVGGLGVLNTTFLAVTAALTYLCVDPIVKAFYVLRCFYGRSLRTGEDLAVELGRVRAAGPVRATLVLAVMAGLIWLPATGAEAGAGGPATAGVEEAASGPVTAVQLDEALRTTLERPEYAWRLPRERGDPELADKTLVERVIDAVGTTLRQWCRAAVRWGRKVRDWLDRVFPGGAGDRDRAGRSGAGLGWVHALLFAALAVVLSVLAVVLVRAWRRRRGPEVVVVAQAVPATPDLTREDVLASQLPVDRWLALAAELLARGERRPALRALYLSALAYLAERGLVALARFKSNRDYERELARRAHALPETAAAFGRSVRAFDRVWYGMHEVDDLLLAQVRADTERIRTSC